MSERRKTAGAYYGSSNGLFNMRDTDRHMHKHASSEMIRAKEASQTPKNMMANAVKNLLIAMDMKSAEEKRFRDEFLSNTHKRGTISRDQLSFIASELKISRTDRCLKSTQITELKSELVGLKNDLELFKTVLQSVLGGGSLSSQRGHALDNIEKEVRATEHVKGYSRRAAASNGLGLEKNDHLDSLDTSSKLSGITSQSFRGESRVRHYENEIIAASEEPPSHSDMPAEIQLYKTNSYRNGSATKLPMRKTSNASSCDSSMILQEKRKHSSDDSLEGLPKKSRNDSCSDDNLAELQQMKKPRTGEHPLLKPTIVSLVLQFVGKGQYLFVCGVHKVWKSVYEAEYDSSKHQTHTIVPLASISALNYAFDCGLDVKNARFKSNATGFPLSLSWWSGHIAPYSTIKRFHELRKGDPMNICGGAASAGRLEVLRCLIEKQKWNCDNGSICINAAEAPKPNVLQWLFLNGIGKWDVVSMASMLRSAALFNRHMNAHFLSLVPKFQSRLKERKHRTMSDLENKSKRQLAIGQPATAKSFSMLDASATNGGSAAKRHRSASPEVALSVRLPNLEKKDGSSMSKGNSDDASQKKQDMLEIAMAAIGYIDKKYNSDTVTSSEGEKGVKVNQSGGSSDGEKDNNKAHSEVNLRMTSEKGAGSGAVSIDKASAIHDLRKSAKPQPVLSIERPLEAS